MNTARKKVTKKHIGIGLGIMGGLILFFVLFRIHYLLGLGILSLILIGVAGNYTAGNDNDWSNG